MRGHWFWDFAFLNSNYHLEHHYFSGVPFYRLPALQRALEGGATVIDTRSAEAFAAGHVPGTISLPLGTSFSTWAGWLIRYDVDLHLVADDEHSLRRAIRDLAMIGLDRVTGWSDSAVIAEWSAAGFPVGTVAKTDAKALAPRLSNGDVTVVDVRNLSEWSVGHLPGAIHIPLGRLSERLAELPGDKPLIVQCQSGGRSAIGVSVLQRLGMTNATNLTGGFAAWEQAGLEVVRDEQLVSA